MKIEVSDLTKFAAVDYEDGQMLLERARPCIQRGENLELDFEGVRIFASPFFNASIAALITEFGPERVENLISFTHLNDEGKIISERSISNAKSMNDPERQKRLAQALEDDDE
jgi:hypothetical protein